MKVESFAYYGLNRKLGYSDKLKNQTAQQNRNFDEYPIGYMPHQVHFGMGKLIWPVEIMELRTLQNLPCLYCGNKMISTKTYNLINYETNPQIRSIKSFLSEMAKNKQFFTPEENTVFEKLSVINEQSPQKPLMDTLKNIGYNSSKKEDLLYQKLTPLEYSNQILETIEDNKDKLYTIEKQVLGEIKKYKNRHPDLTLPEIFTGLRPKHVKALIKEQIRILNVIENIANILPENLKEKVLDLTAPAKKIILNDDLQNPFCRQEFIEKAIRLREKIPKKEHNQIMGKVVKLPFSESSIDAFIVKHSGKSSSDIKIGQGLLYRSIATVEHIRPQKNFHGDVNIKNKNSINNCGIAHADCNMKRRNTPINKHLQHNAEIISKSIPQKQMDVIIENINNGVLKNCRNYPSILKKTLFMETNGKINLDISKLMPQKEINKN